jgi:hypothetical protein
MAFCNKLEKDYEERDDSYDSGQLVKDETKTWEWLSARIEIRCAPWKSFQFNGLGMDCGSPKSFRSVLIKFFE